MVFLLPRTPMMSKTVNFYQYKRWSIRWSSRKPTVINKTTIDSTIVQPPLVGKTNTSISDSSVVVKSKTSGRNKKGKFSKLFQKNWTWKVGSLWILLSLLDWWLLTTGNWFTWSSLLMRWTPIGVCVYAAIEWQLHKQKLNREGLPAKTASPFQTNMYCFLPLRLLSRCWGWVADCRIPETLRPFIYGLYSYTFKVNLDEAANPDLKAYKSLSEFFTRPLRDDCRLINKNCCLVSPADGTVLHYGLATDAQIEQVKGVTYSLDTFLGPDNWIEKKRSTSYIENIKYKNDEKTSLYQCIIYLAPGDYHRFHSPAEWEPQIRRHFIGELLSVSPKIAQWLPGLFCLNERVTYIGKWNYGFFSFTAVGATNVGSVQIYFDNNLKTNKWIGFKPIVHKYKHCEEIILPPKVKLNKGELLGQFNMGSTIVLIFEAPKEFKFSVTERQKIKMGESLGYIDDKK